jgi:predicted HTH transcriptional regulator
MAQAESDLLRLLHSTEHSFVERKTVSDGRDWAKTVVAFANTLPSGQEGVLFIGATDAGEIESRHSNLDSIQKTLSDKMLSVYPPIYYTRRVVQESARECLAVIVPGSPLSPHFAGPPYVRVGSQSFVASSQQYESLLAARTGKAYELQRWEGKLITLLTLSRQNGIAYVVNKNSQQATVVGANQFYLTVSFGNRTYSYPLSRIEISFDHTAGRLEVQLEGLPEPY